MLLPGRNKKFYPTLPERYNKHMIVKYNNGKNDEDKIPTYYMNNKNNIMSQKFSQKNELFQ